MRMSRAAPAVTAALLGPIVFFLLFDPRLLGPSYFRWLFWLPDPATQFLGWHFFRLDNWYLPPGAATNYGMEMGSSVVFTDSIPVAALLFKLARDALPDHFQYFGIWTFACYILQGGFGWLISGLFTRIALQRLAMTALFVLSPLLPDRGIGHYALMAHWLVLAALYLYLRAPTRLATASWCLLICGAALIHAYLLYMVLAVAFADAARRRWIDHTATTRDTLRSTLLIAVPLLGTMWLAGYFTIPTSSFSGGAVYYGRYAANLNSLWNPQWGSLFLPGLSVIPGSELEGFNYLGFGVLAMTPIALLPLLRSRAFPVAKAYLPLLIVSLGLWLMALSNQIAWGNRILLNIPVPLEILNFVAMVRGSGRLLWVAYYALVLAIPALIVRNYSPLAATAILGIGLALQIADLSPRFVTLNHYFHQHFIDEPAQRTNPLKSLFWNAAARHYTTILFVPSLPVPKDFGSLALFAADHGMKINTGSFARYSVERVADATARRIRELEDGHQHRDSLYILADPNSTPFRAAPDDATGIVDGYLVLAPGWFGFEESRDGTEPSLVPSDVTVSKPNSMLP